MPKGKGARARYQAIQADVAAWVNYAFYSKDYTNPYEPSDKRHLWFKRKLHHTLGVDSDFRDMHEIMGGDLSKLQLRSYDKPTLVPLSSFGGQHTDT